MANDQPTSLRMDFGGKRAFEAGMAEFGVPTTADMNSRLRWKRAAKELREFLEQNPSSLPAFLKLLDEHRAKKLPFGPIPQIILSQLRRSLTQPTKSRFDRREW